MKSLLFCPSLDEDKMIKIKKYNQDCIIFDLEDSISIDDKENARLALKNVMTKESFNDFKVIVRINGINTPFFYQDLKVIIKSNIKTIRIPMCETKEDIIILDNYLKSLEKNNNMDINTIKIQCSIETPLGVDNVKEIINTSKRVTSVSFGSEDYTNSLGVERSKDFNQFLYARSVIAIAASIKNIIAIDTVFSDINDLEGFKKEAIHVKNLGFSGKSCLHPKQVSIANEVFSPTKEEITFAIQIINKLKDNKNGVFQIDGKMIDKPIIERARKTLDKIN